MTSYFPFLSVSLVIAPTASPSLILIPTVFISRFSYLDTPIVAIIDLNMRGLVSWKNTIHFVL